MVGNLEYRVGLDASAALGGRQARLAVSLAPPVNGIIPNEIWSAISIKDTAGTAGVATWHWPLEAGKVTPGQQVWMQWVIDDAAALRRTGSTIARIHTILRLTGLRTGVHRGLRRQRDGRGADLFAFERVFRREDPRRTSMATAA